MTSVAEDYLDQVIVGPRGVARGVVDDDATFRNELSEESVAVVVQLGVGVDFRPRPPPS